jgi:hypothetical protein
MGHDAVLELHRALKASTPGLKRPGLDQEEVSHLAHELAEMEARSLISSVSCEEEIDGVEWIDVTQDALAGEPVADACKDELRYLELRGMLEHHPTRPNLVRIVGND